MLKAGNQESFIAVDTHALAKVRIIAITKYVKLCSDEEPIMNINNYKYFLKRKKTQGYLEHLALWIEI